MVTFNTVKLRDCLGFLKLSYELSELNEPIIHFFDNWGEVSLYKFSKTLIKVKGDNLNISGVLGSDSFIVTYYGSNKEFRSNQRYNFEKELGELNYTVRC